MGERTPRRSTPLRWRTRPPPPVGRLCRLRWIGALIDPPRDASGRIFDWVDDVGRVLPRDEWSRQQTVPVRVDADSALPHKIHSELLFTDSAGVVGYATASAPYTKSQATTSGDANQ